MDLDGALRTHPRLRVERPPVLWEADTDETPFARLLAGPIGLGVRHGATPADLTFNVANVTIGESAAGERLPRGDYVVVTVRGRGRWWPEAVWWPGAVEG